MASLWVLNRKYWYLILLHQISVQLNAVWEHCSTNQKTSYVLPKLLVLTGHTENDPHWAYYGVFNAQLNPTSSRKIWEIGPYLYDWKCPPSQCCCGSERCRAPSWAPGPPVPESGRWCGPNTSRASPGVFPPAPPSDLYVQSTLIRCWP